MSIVSGSRDHVKYIWYEKAFLIQWQRSECLVHLSDHQECVEPERMPFQVSSFSLYGVFATLHCLLIIHSGFTVAQMKYGEALFS